MGTPLVIRRPGAPRPSRRPQREWARNPIDRFVLARLDRESLKALAEADRATLLRVSFDHWPPAHPRRNRRLPRRQILRRLRKQVDRLLALRNTASAWRCNGSISPATPTPTAIHRLAARHVEVARLGDRRLQPQHALRPVRHRADRRRRSPTPASSSASPAASAAITWSTTRAAPSPSIRSNMSPTAWTPPPASSWASPWAVPAATTIRPHLAARLTTASSPSSTPSPRRDSTAKTAPPHPRTAHTAEQAGEPRGFNNPLPTTRPPFPKRSQPLLAAWRRRPTSLGAHQRPAYRLPRGHHFGRPQRQGNPTFIAGQLAGARLQWRSARRVPHLPSRTIRRRLLAALRRPQRDDRARRRTRFRYRRGRLTPAARVQTRLAPLRRIQGRRWHSASIVYGGDWHHIAVNFENGAPTLLLDAKPSP